MLPADLTLRGIEFQRVGTANKKATVPIFVSILGKYESELDDRHCLDFLAGVSSEIASSETVTPS